MVNENLLRTVSLDRKPGVLMERGQYEQVKQFILQVLDSHDEVTLNDLLSFAPICFQKELRGNAGWFIYQVKIDLEARGLIKQSLIKNYTKTAARKMSKKTILEIPQVNLEVAATQIKINQGVKDKFIELFGEYPIMIILLEGLT